MKIGLFLALTFLAVATMTSCTSNGGDAGASSTSDGYFGPAPSTPVEQTARFSTGLGNATRSTVR
ncbi:MAG: hypothetical protein P1U85_05410 [Verrucomicrobiales bacterium]|nr:hypothetical protein [Verrucomicrobiales bacterium]